MLCGFPPFYAEDNNELFEYIKNAKYEFASPYWDHVSEEAKDLIQKLLVVEPSKRLSCEEILKHPWLNKCNYSNETLMFKDDYTEFRKKIKLKSAIMASLIVNCWKKIVFDKK
jgi:serine/threonine protein kinase